MEYNQQAVENITANFQLLLASVIESKDPGRFKLVMRLSDLALQFQKMFTGSKVSDLSAVEFGEEGANIINGQILRPAFGGGGIEDTARLLFDGFTKLHEKKVASDENLNHARELKCLSETLSTLTDEKMRENVINRMRVLSKGVAPKEISSGGVD